MIRRRKPLRRGKPPKRTPLQRSPWIRSSTTWPRRSKAKMPRRARPEDRLATWCEAKTEKCTGRAEHRHHLRGRVGAGVDERDSTLDVCDACHRWIHAHPKISYERGWLLRRNL